MDLCMTKHTVFEGSAALSVGPDPQKLAKASDLMRHGSRIWLDHSSGAPRVVICYARGFEYGLTTALERPEW